MAPTTDGILEGSIVGSFTNVGYRLRSGEWEADMQRMDGATAIVTGATSGIGLATAHQMAALGARVVLVGRNQEKLDSALDEIAESSSNGEAAGYRADLSSLDELRRLAGELLAGEQRIDVLVNNASVLAPDRATSVDGFELTLATNLLGTFLLTNLLIPRMVESAPARIITVSSGGMYTEALDVSGIEMTPEDYGGSAAYARTKRAQVVLTDIWADRLAGTGVVAHSMHPGWVGTPGVAASLPTFRRVMGPLLRNADQGADTIVWLAADSDALGSSGEFWMDRRPRSKHRLKRTRAGDAGADLLWEFLCEATGWVPPSGWPQEGGVA
jgi:NAD(P)-dependent dehydrogenase (short-subunit alcohol dehydrogenase family)